MSRIGIPNAPIPPGTYAKPPVVGDGRQHVAASGSNGNDGLSEGTAKATVAGAVAALPSTGGDVYVGAGTFSGAIPITSKNVRIHCAGRVNTTLTVPSGGTLFVFTGPFDSGSGAQFILEGATLLGGAGSRAVNLAEPATFVSGSFVVRDCNVVGWGAMAFTFGQSNYFSSFERVHFAANAGSLSFGLFSDHLVEDCQFSNPVSAPSIVTYGGSSGTIRGNTFTYGTGTGTEPDILLLSDTATAGGHELVEGNKFGPENDVAGRVKVKAHSTIVNRLLLPRLEAVKIRANDFFGVAGQTAIQLDDPILGWGITGNHYDGFAVLVNDNQSNTTGESGNSIFSGNTVRSDPTGASTWKTFANGGRGFAIIEPPLGLSAELTVRAEPRQMETAELRNRLAYSEDLTQAAWVKNGVTIDAPQTDPFGTTRATALHRVNAGTSESVSAAIAAMAGFKGAGGQAAPAGGIRLVVTLWAMAGTLNTLLASIFDSADGLLVGTPTLQLSTRWKRYRLTFSGLSSAAALTLNLYPGGTRQAAGYLFVFGIQVSDDDTDYLPTSGAAATSAVIGARSEALHQFAGGLAAKVKAGTPSDADFPAAPPDGTIVPDSSGSKIWVRLGGTWKGVAVA
jgi:hypothetical protein